MTEAIAQAARAGEDLLARAERDEHRPRFHVVAPAGWLNDPNGVGQWDGVYHLFYQYNPVAPVHDRIHWGHLTSRDLVTWTDEPVALVPGPGGPDADGCWSGVLVDDGGAPTLVYSGHRTDELEVGCLATGTPDLRAWTKDAANPVVEAPEGLDVVAFRDHCVWREDGRWRQLVGAGIRGVGGTALLFEGEDLRTWRYVGPLVVGDAGGGPLDGTLGAPDWTATMWECIDLFHLAADGSSGPPRSGGGDGPGADGDDGRDVLVFSAWDDGRTLHPLALTGTYAGDAFVPDRLHRLDLGEGALYAPQSFTDDSGRRILFGWIQEQRPPAAALAAGWSGAMSLPRVVTLDASGTPALAPAVEVEALRRDHVHLVGRDGARVLRAGEEVPGPRGVQLDVEASLVLAPDSRVHLVVRAAGDDGERTVVEVGRASSGEGWLRLDRSAGSLDRAMPAAERGGAIPVGPGGRVDLRVVVDRSVLEVFANGRALTSRVYPVGAGADGTRLAVPAGGPDAVVERFEVWRMADAWSGPRSLWP